MNYFWFKMPQMRLFCGTEIVSKTAFLKVNDKLKQIRQSGVENRTGFFRENSFNWMWCGSFKMIFLYSLMLPSHERCIYFWQVKISFETLQYRSLLYPVGPWTLGVQIRGYWSLLMCSVTPERVEMFFILIGCSFVLLGQGKAGFREPRPPSLHSQQGLKCMLNKPGFHLNMTREC